jgi:uncharacterized protein (DUF2141 family)
MIFDWSSLMNFARYRRFPARFSRIAARLIVWIWLATTTTLTIAQTQDYPQPAKSSLGQISGYVYRSDTNEPIPKAQVVLYPPDPSTVKAFGSERIVRTGADGSFAFLDLPAGTFGISVWRSGFSEYSRQDNDDNQRFITLKLGQKLENLTLHLHPTGVIAGQVSDEDQEAIEGLEVFALRIAFQPGGRKQVSAAGRTITDDLGNFRMPNLQPGSYFVSAGGLIQHPMGVEALKQDPASGMHYRNTFYPGTPSLDEAQTLKVGPELTTNDIRFTVPTERTYSITGKVLSGVGGPALKDAEVSCERVDAAGYTFGTAGQTVQVEPDHSFNFSSLSPGDYTLTVQKVNQGVRADLGFASVRVVDSNVRANIEVGRAAEVHGTVQAPQGLPVTGKQITLETFGSGFYLLHQSPALRAAGPFTITNLPPGEYALTVSDRTGDQSVYVKKAVCSGRDYAGRAFSLTVGTTLDCDVILANDTGVVHGEVTSGENPASGAVVVLIPESGDLRRVPRYTLSAEADAAGQYRIAGVIPGDYLLFAVSPSADHAYYALDFADRHADVAEHVTIDSGATQTVSLKLSKLE